MSHDLSHDESHDPYPPIHHPSHIHFPKGKSTILSVQSTDETFMEECLPRFCKSEMGVFDEGFDGG